jgi:hypothetical protein
VGILAPALLALIGVKYASVPEAYCWISEARPLESEERTPEERNQGCCVQQPSFKVS